MASLARALTKRTKRGFSNEKHVSTRESSVRATINRDLISLPTELISTTNVNALNAPNISDLNTISSSASSNSSIMSGSDSDFTTISRNFIDSATTTPTASIESSPVSSDPSKTISFFDIPQRSATTAGVRPSSSSSTEAPAIPQRALSHSKKAHVELSRKRSMSRLSPPPTSLAGPIVARNSVDMFAGAAEPGHPFVKELAQVNEVAEEFGLVSANLVQEERDLVDRGLQKFTVDDYLDEIQGMYGGVFEDKLGPMANPWI